MGAKYVSERPIRQLNERNPMVIRGERVIREAYAKQRAFDDLPEQSMANYGKEDYRLKQDEPN